MLNFENLDRGDFELSGEFGIPKIPRVKRTPDVEFIPFNYAKTTAVTVNRGVHFFVDDYQFMRLWNSPTVYSGILGKFGVITAPDFSTYTDMPPALQIYNHYRKHWLAAFYAARGITVIPTISWSTRESFRWCFDGEPTESVIAISTVGCIKDNVARELFETGYSEMTRRLRPVQVLIFGSKPDFIGGNFRVCEPYYDTIRLRRGALN